MNSKVENNKRIAKNTIVLYIRMFFILAISLYTSRVVLQVLGIEDFGIYNVVASVIVLFSFINNSLIIATQRFLNIELGRHNLRGAQKVFSTSLNIYLFVIFLILLFSETIGIFLFKEYVKIPTDRFHAAIMVFHLSIVGLCLNFLKAPYNACIIAEERMTTFSVISIIDAVLKLVIVWIVPFLLSDRLISYALLMTLVMFLIFLIYWGYCVKNLQMCKYSFTMDRQLFKQIGSFSGWSLLGGFSSIAVAQGLNILLNVFGGVAVNAAYGVANQVQSGVLSFSSSFQTAFSPQIVKYYGKGDISEMRDLIFSSSKFSFFLILLIALPFVALRTELISLWLTKIPPYAVDFSGLVVILSMFEALAAPLWLGISATGKISKYQIGVSIILLLNLPLSFCLLKKGFSPVWVFLVRIVISIVQLVYRVFYLNKVVPFPVGSYFRNVIGVSFLVTLLAGLPVALLLYFGVNNFILLLFVSVTSVFVSIIIVGLKRSEKDKLIKVMNMIKSRFFQRVCSK